MAKVCILYVGVVMALALCKYSMAEWNVTSPSANGNVSACPHHGDGDNCTDTDPWGGHFSKCPETLTNYCVHGECRYIEEQQAPSCRCHVGFMGSRCELLDLDLRWGEKRNMIISCVIVVLLVLIFVIVGICISAHVKSRVCCRRRRRREAPSNGTEKLSMMDARAAQTTSMAESTEMTRTHAV